MDYPILTLDHSHNHAAGLEHPAIYSISAAKGIILVPDKDLGEVNAVQIILGENAIYHTEWDGKISLRIDDKTAAPLKANEPFSGFLPGKAIIGIGAYKDDGTGKAAFYVNYVLMLEIF